MPGEVQQEVCFSLWR